MFSSKLSTAAGGAALGMALTNMFTASSAPAAETTPDTQPAPQVTQRQITPDDIKNRMQVIFSDNAVSANEISELKGLLAAHKAADPTGYAAFTQTIQQHNPSLYSQLELG